MAWYDRCGPGADVFVSTRVRIARNFEGYPFANKLSKNKAEELISKVSDAFSAQDGYDFCNMKTLSQIEALSLAERHLISHEFAKKQAPHALVSHETKGLSIMVCEEDHLRIGCFASGLAIKECMEHAFEAEEIAGKALPYAFDDSFGYLTHCPTNLGTGVRVSVMLFLPALSLLGKMQGIISQLQKLGLTARGMLGEGSEASGYLYQISNQVTLGISEEETAKKVTDVVRQIAELERKERKALDASQKLHLAHRAGVAEGTFRFGKRLSFAEFLPLWADLRLGIALGENVNISFMTMDKLFFEAMPATVALSVKENDPSLSAEEMRDVMRATFIQTLLSSEVNH